MKKRAASSLLLASLSITIGCYNNETVTREEFDPAAKAALAAGAEERDIAVFTKDSLEFRFLKDNYRIQDDTLKGFGVQLVRGEETLFQGRVFLGEIVALETEEFSLTKTILAIGIPLGILTTLFAVWVAGFSRI